MEPGLRDRLPGLLVRDLALDPDPLVQVDLDRHGPIPGGSGTATSCMK